MLDSLPSSALPANTPSTWSCDKSRQIVYMQTAEQRALCGHAGIWECISMQYCMLDHSTVKVIRVRYARQYSLVYSVSCPQKTQSCTHTLGMAGIPNTDSSICPSLLSPEFQSLSVKLKNKTSRAWSADR